MFTSLCQFRKTLVRTGSETVFTEMFTDFPPGSSKQGSQWNGSRSVVTIIFFTPGTMLLRGRDSPTQAQLNIF